MGKCLVCGATGRCSKRHERLQAAYDAMKNGNILVESFVPLTRVGACIGSWSLDVDLWRSSERGYLALEEVESLLLDSPNADYRVEIESAVNTAKLVAKGSEMYPALVAGCTAATIANARRLSSKDGYVLLTIVFISDRRPAIGLFSKDYRSLRHCRISSMQSQHAKLIGVPSEDLLDMLRSRGELPMPDDDLIGDVHKLKLDGTGYKTAPGYALRIGEAINYTDRSF